MNSTNSSRGGGTYQEYQVQSKTGSCFPLACLPLDWTGGELVDIVNIVHRCSHLARHPGGVVVNHIERKVRVPVAQHLALRFLMLLLFFVDSLSFFYILIDFMRSCNNAVP